MFVKTTLLAMVVGLLLPLQSCSLLGTGANEGVRVEIVAQNLEVPWEIAFAPDGRIFLTERPGRIRLIQEGVLLQEPWAGIEVAAVGEAGLLGLALDPAFSQNRYVYIYYTYRDDQGILWNRVARLLEREGRGTDLTVILDRIPGASIHDGGRIKFGPDEKLYIATGDAANPSLAQDFDSLAGKILRINSDGSIPEDNPFPGSPIYSYGHRNPQGLAWHPLTKKLFGTEHGPSGVPPNCCHDEVNIIEPGKNYGWPIVFGMAGDPRFVDPILESGLETWAPSGASFYSGNELPESWKDNLFFAALRDRHLHRVILQPPEFTKVQLHEKLFAGAFGRLRDVVQGLDGFLYLVTSNRDGRGTPTPDDDRILRIISAR